MERHTRSTSNDHETNFQRQARVISNHGRNEIKHASRMLVQIHEKRLGFTNLQLPGNPTAKIPEYPKQDRESKITNHEKGSKPA